MVLLSIPAVFNAIAVDPIMANGSLCLVLFFMVLLVSLATADAPIRVAAEQIVGSMGGGGVGVGVIYLTMAINGGTYRDTVTKGVVMVLLSAAVMFLSTVFRFRYKSATLVWMFFGLTYAITTAASYHAQSKQWKFTVFWFAYSAVGGAVAYLCATFVLPVTAGAIVRRRLAAGLELTSDALRQLVELVTGDVSPDSGLLAAASGETAQRIGLDSGLYPQLQKLYASATAAGQAIQVAYSHLDSAPLQLDVYRRQRRFPLKPLGAAHHLVSLCCSTRSCSWCTRPRRAPCTALLLARHRAPLLRWHTLWRSAAPPWGMCLCRTRQSALRWRSSQLWRPATPRWRRPPVSRAARSPRTRLRWTCCSACSSPPAQGCGASPCCCRRLWARTSPPACTLCWTTLLLSWRMMAAGEVPFAGVAGVHGRVEWDFTTLTQIPLQRQESNPIDVLRASLLAVQPKRSASRAAAELLAQPEVLHLPRAAPQQGKLQRCLGWLKARTGVTPEHLALGLQMVAAYVPLLIMLIIPAVNNTFDNHLIWALFVVVSVLQPAQVRRGQTAGECAAIFKGLQRLVGTVLAGALGVCSQYLAFLVNGLRVHHRERCAGHHALPGYQGNVTRPLLAVWRVANTALGVVVEVAAVSLVLPVTAGSCSRATMAATLDRMGGVARTALRPCCPRRHAATMASRQAAAREQAAGHQQQGQQQEQQQQQQEQPDGVEQQPEQQAAPGAVEGVPSPFAQLNAHVQDHWQCVRTASARCLLHLCRHRCHAGHGPRLLHYEFYPRSAIHRFQFEAGFRAQRLCRHMLNIIAGAVIVLDSHEVAGLPMLAPFAQRMEQLIEQLAACLEALAAMVRKQASPDEAVGTVLALEEHAQRLFMLVLASDLPSGLGEADVINGLALLSVLINASYVSRLLALALIRCFHPSPPGAGPTPAEAALLARGSTTRWAADDRTLQPGAGHSRGGHGGGFHLGGQRQRCWGRDATGRNAAGSHTCSVKRPSGSVAIQIGRPHTPVGGHPQGRAGPRAAGTVSKERKR
ncbi:hypothetical protein ABPG77_006826 [Micractinium sp. CCAP 211/92]